MMVVDNKSHDGHKAAGLSWKGGGYSIWQINKEHKGARLNWKVDGCNI